MEKYRRARIITIIVLMVVMAGLTIGFAAFTSVLTISSSAKVTPSDSTFSVKFSNKKDSLDESAVVPSNVSTGVEYTNGKISNTASPTLSNLSAVFTSPGQSVTYTVYARNEGEYTAYLNNINYIGEKTCTAGSDATASLVEAACNSIKMTVTVAGREYTATTAISGHALSKKTGEEVKVKLSYDSSGERADGEFTVNFGDVTMVYSSVDDSTFVPPIVSSENNSQTINYVMKQGAVSDSSIDFSSSSGLDVENNTAYVVSGTENDINPIYYYRGNVTKNNVVFANFCWKIVRTTETGGVKLIYNGVPAADGSCNNTGAASQIGTSNFNTGVMTRMYGSYMYGNSYYLTFNYDMTSYIYSKNYVWNGSKYVLDNPVSLSAYSANNYYTCFNSDGVCDTLSFIYYCSSGNDYCVVQNLENGSSIESQNEEMFINTNNSVIKTIIDTWYASNMVNYTSKLEDTVWCNDRSYYVDGAYFGAYLRNVKEISPSLYCPNENDKFTVSPVNGNGDLIYPVGLLTADEVTLAGNGSSGYSSKSYLTTGNVWWTLSPWNFIEGTDAFSVFGVANSGIGQGNVIYNGVRPAVSLAPNTEISGGDGSVTTPYIIS